MRRRDKSEIVLDLERLVIKNRTLFPGLEGLARGPWQAETMRTSLRDMRDPDGK